MQKMTLAEWQAEGRRRFGPEIENWRWRCPMCGHIASGQDFKDAGADPDACYVECIGRYTGKGSPKEGDSSGCNWAAYGLFGIPREDKYVVRKDGEEFEIFPFADPEEKE